MGSSLKTHHSMKKSRPVNKYLDAKKPFLREIFVLRRKRVNLSRSDLGYGTCLINSKTRCSLVDTCHRHVIAACHFVTDRVGRRRTQKLEMFGSSSCSVPNGCKIIALDL